MQTQVLFKDVNDLLAHQGITRQIAVATALRDEAQKKADLNYLTLNQPGMKQHEATVNLCIDQREEEVAGHNREIARLKREAEALTL